MKKEKPVQAQEQEQVQPATEYWGLPGLLHRVRWTQHFFAILAEILMLVAFFGSGMDLNMGGIMANIVGVKWVWGATFALGLDTSFVISWVRCRQVGWSWHLLWCIPVALGMSAVVLQPVVIQLLQSSLSISFTQAVSMLGIDIVILVWVRSIVAVALGAVLALTNVESSMKEEASRVSSGRRTFLPLQKLMDKYMPVVDTLPAQAGAPIDTVSVHEEKPERVQIEGPKPKRPIHPIELVPVPEPIERVRRALSEQPNASDRQIAKMSNVSPTTAGKYRKIIENQQSEAV